MLTYPDGIPSADIDPMGIDVFSCVHPSVLQYVGLGFGIADKSIGKKCLYLSLYVRLPFGFGFVELALGMGKADMCYWGMVLAITGVYRDISFGLGEDCHITLGDGFGHHWDIYGDFCCRSWQHILVWFHINPHVIATLDNGIQALLLLAMGTDIVKRQCPSSIRRNKCSST